jgi:phage shock protein A
MTNRKKRLKKGIESLQEEIEKHKLKLAEAIKKGEEELAGYYQSEIASLEKSKEHKKELLDKA